MNSVITKTIIDTLEFLKESLVNVENGKEKTDMVNSHCGNLVKLIGSQHLKLDDATSALKEVREQVKLLGEDNVSLIRNAISRSSHPSSNQRVSKKTAKISYDSQDHYYIENYFTETIWEMLKSDRQIREKLLEVSEFVVNTVGLHYPRELTVASILGVVFAAHGKHLSYQQARDHLLDFKEILRAERKSR